MHNVLKQEHVRVKKEFIVLYFIERNIFYCYSSVSFHNLPGAKLSEWRNEFLVSTKERR